MSAPNDPTPKGIPDMSLGERQETPPALAPLPSPAPTPPRDSEIQRATAPRPVPALPAQSANDTDAREWQEGDRVLSPWEPTFLYPGTIRQIMIDEDKGDQALIRFDDGGEGWVFVYSLCPLEFSSGQQVQARRGNGVQYFPGEIAELDGKDVHIHYDDGGTEWTTITALRRACVANGPGAAATQLAAWQPQSAPEQGGTGIPSWAITVGLGVLLLVLRIGCRMSQN